MRVGCVSRVGSWRRALAKGAFSFGARSSARSARGLRGCARSGRVSDPRREEKEPNFGPARVDGDAKPFSLPPTYVTYEAPTTTTSPARRTFPGPCKCRPPAALLPCSARRTVVLRAPSPVSVHEPSHTPPVLGHHPTLSPTRGWLLPTLLTLHVNRWGIPDQGGGHRYRPHPALPGDPCQVR